MITSRVELTIAVNNYRNPQLLKLCLQSIQRNAPRPYELLVADSATEEDTAMLMREEYTDAGFISFSDNVGFQKLVSASIEQSTGSFILLLNGDIMLQPGAVEALVGYMRSHPDVGMVGPQLLNFNGSPQDSCFRFYKPQTIVYRRTWLGKLPWARRHLDWFLMRDYDRQLPQEVDWLMGSAQLVRRSAVNEVGLMDPKFFLYMEDVDWCRRFWEHKWKVVYVPAAKMYHYHGKGSAGGGLVRMLTMNKLTWIHICSALRYFWKYSRKRVPPHAEPA